MARRPLISVDAVDYTDSNNVTQTLDEAAYYTHACSQAHHAGFGAFPTLGNGGAIAVTYTAGFAEGEQAEELELARQAILMLVAHWFENRETVFVGAVATSEVPFAAKSLIDRFRTRWRGGQRRPSEQADYHSAIDHDGR
jgi:uncharacterized phiE125 gp8 family phage protein